MGEEFEFDFVQREQQLALEGLGVGANFPMNYDEDWRRAEESETDPFFV